MSLIKRNGLLPAGFPALFDDFFGRERFNWDNSNYSATSTTVPSVNIRETGEHFEVEMAAPGMEKNDFKIELDGNTLTIRSHKEQEQKSETDGYSRKEFSYQSFHRSFLLPKDVVDDNGIAARYENGVLYLRIPKQEQAKQKAPRLIEIS